MLLQKISRFISPFVLMLCIYIAYLIFSGNLSSSRLGGEKTVNLPKGQRLLFVSWRNNDLWVLTEKQPDNYNPKEYEYQEYSNLNVLSGKVIIKER